MDTIVLKQTKKIKSSKHKVWDKLKRAYNPLNINWDLTAEIQQQAILLDEIKKI